MPTTTPVIFSEIHNEEIEINQSIDEEILKKIVQNNNWLLLIYPIGSIIFVNVNQVGVIQPDSRIFKICDGTQINNPDSPFDGQNAPLLIERFVRFSSTTIGNETGGTLDHTILSGHSHGTSTPLGDGAKNLQKGGDNLSRSNDHEHDVPDNTGELPDVSTWPFPANINLVPYLKIM